MNIGIFGATGLVGKEFLKLIENDNTLSSIRVFASKSSVGKYIKFRDINIILEDYDETTFTNLNVVILCTSTKVSKLIAPIALKNKCFIIDNSSAFRMDINTPLIIPEINGHLIESNNLISNPNCCTAILCTVLDPLNKINHIKRVIVSTYQSASGAGQKGINELLNSNDEFPVFGRKYMFNVFSHNSDIDIDSKYNDEEIKIMEETKKILDYDIKITATCVRVPVLRAHSESVNIEFENPVDLNEIRNIFNKQEGIKLEDNFELNEFPEPLKAENNHDILVGRIRYDLSDKSNRTINLFICGDQLLKGAALNAYQIYKLFCNKLFLNSTNKLL
jgi:aspartate-semialdehyde dehydrogenase